MSDLINLYNLDLAELTDFMAGLGQPAYRARQLWQWLYHQFAADFSEMTTLPRELRERLAGAATLGVQEPVLEQHSSDGQTEKVLFQLADGNYIETVLM